MKKISLLLVFISILTSAFSQDRSRGYDVYFQTEKNIEFSENLIQLQNPELELKWMKFNLDNYHKSRQTAFYLQIAGALATGASFFIKDEDVQVITAGVGFTLSVSGFITMLSSEKHLKYSTIPAPR